MFDTFLQWFFNTIVTFFSTIINIITTPILSLLKTSIPDFTSYYSTLFDFINNYIIKGVKFSKMVIVNTLQLNHSIFNIAVLIFSFSFAVFLATRSFKLVSNIWSIKDNGKSTK